MSELTAFLVVVVASLVLPVFVAILWNAFRFREVPCDICGSWWTVHGVYEGRHYTVANTYCFACSTRCSEVVEKPRHYPEQ